MTNEPLTYASLSRVGLFRRGSDWWIVDYDTARNEWVEAPVNIASYSGTATQTIETLTASMEARRRTLKAMITRRANRSRNT
jgi:hypothetical protein